jgi:hypothetical protein
VKKTMLPSFPKSQKILDEEWNKIMFSAKAKVFPTHIHPPVLPIIKGKESDFQRDDGQVKPLKMEHHKVTSQHSIKDGKGMALPEFKQKASEVGEALGKQMWGMLTGVVQEAAAETGNEVKIKKGELKQEDVLRMLDMVQQNFDEHGNPTQQLVCGSELAAELKKRETEWSNDKEFQAKVAEIQARKKAEFYEREARRRLVG